MTVAGDEGLAKEVARVVKVVGPGEWITGGLWGAYEQWALGAETGGSGQASRWLPDRRTIDALTPQNPCLLSSFDGKLLLANTAALRAYTINNAVAAFDGGSRGSIAAGKLADLVVVDRNLLRIDPRDILNMNVDLTMVDGRVVYERQPR